MENIDRVRFISDQPLYEASDDKLTDGLGFDRYVKVLANFASSTEGPFTIGINGSWGQGKTSLLRLIEKQLTNEDGRTIRRVLGKDHSMSTPNNLQETIIPVRFNAWQFENEADSLLPLILTISATLEKVAQGKVYRKKSLKKLGTTLASIAAGLVASTELSIDAAKMFGGTFSPKSFISAYRRRSKPSAHLASLLSQKTVYYQAFELLHAVCEDIKGDIRIVVFVDDLDRCSPGKALQVLENIKLVLWQPGFIFFLAVDTNQLESYINHSGVESGQMGGGRYFEKLLQVNFRIPQHSYDYSSFTDSLMGQLGWVDKDNTIKPLLGAPLDFNPRRTIRLVNSIQLIRQLLPKELAVDIQIVTVEVLLAIRYQRVYRLLCGGHADENQQARSLVLGWLGEGQKFSKKLPSGLSVNSQAANIWLGLAEDDRYAKILQSIAGKAWLGTSEDSRRAIARLIEDQKILVDFSEEIATSTKQSAKRRSKNRNPTAERDPDRVLDEAWDLAQTAMREGKLLSAERALGRILDIDDHNAAAFNRLGIIYAKKLEYQKAITCFEAAAKIEETASSLHNLGLIYYETENYKKSAAAFKKALRLEDGLAARHVAYAKVNEKLGKEKLMIESLRRAVDLEPNRETYTLLRQAYKERGMLTELDSVEQKLKRLR